MTLFFIFLVPSLAKVMYYETHDTIFLGTFAEVVARAGDGHTVLLDRGVNIIDTDVTITKDITIQGQGSDAILSFKNGARLFIESKRVTLTSFTIEGMTHPLDVSQTYVNIIKCNIKGGQLIYKEDTPGSQEAYTLTISDSTFTREDDATGEVEYGGLMELSLRHSSVAISSSSLANGKATHGGCLYLKTHDKPSPTSVSLTNVNLNGCVAQGNGGGAYIQLENQDLQSSITIDTTSFKRNIAVGGGGGLYLAKTPREDPMAFSLADVTFEGNVAMHGGGLFLSNSATSALQQDYAKYIHFFNNKAVKKGGGMYVSPSTSPRHLKSHFTFAFNTAGFEEEWNAVKKAAVGKIEGYTAGEGMGGGIYILDSSSSLTSGKLHLSFRPHYVTPIEYQKGNRAAQGGFIASHIQDLTVSHLATFENEATKNGGALCLFGDQSTKINDSLLLKDSAGFTGGAIFMEKGELDARRVLIKEGSAHKMGGGISAIGAISGISLHDTKIVMCRARSDGGSAIYYKSSHSPSSITLDEGCLIASNVDAPTSAIVIDVDKELVDFSSTGSEYLDHPNGHLAFTTALANKTLAHVSFTSQEDYYDASPLKGGYFDVSPMEGGETPSVLFEASSQTTFKGSFFASVAGCGGQSSRAMKKECDGRDQYYPSGWYGGTKILPSKEKTIACVEHLNECGGDMHSEGSQCAQFNRCYNGDEADPIVLRDYHADFPDLLAPVPKLGRDATSSSTTTTTTTTTEDMSGANAVTTLPPATPPSSVDPNSSMTPAAPKANPYCGNFNVPYKYPVGWIGAEEASCKAVGHCWDSKESDPIQACYAKKATGAGTFTPGTTCYVKPSARIEAGWSGIPRKTCLLRNACWNPTHIKGPWCYWATATP